MTNASTPQAHGHVLATYRTAAGDERLLVAVPNGDDPSPLSVVDTKADPAPDADCREVEPRIDSLREAEALAADYIIRAAQLGGPLMPTTWW